MSSNSFGKLFKMTSWGESHGKAVGVVVDGAPAGILLNESIIDSYLSRRRVGQSDITSQRKEDDKSEILSGIFEGKTTGAPISIIVKNSDAKSSDYDQIKDLFRPSHADYTYRQKYGIVDYRGGGRSSARETIARVAAGAIADQILKLHKIQVFAHVIQVKDIVATKFEFDQINKNDVRCADKDAAAKMIEVIKEARSNQDSVGAIVEVVARNVKVGLGEPIYDKLDANLAKALISINAIKGVEIGSGFRLVNMYGSESNDQMDLDESGNVKFLSNNSGGIDGGISNGNDIVAKVVCKPTPSISREQKSINSKFEKRTIKIKGRHDPCVAPRAVPVIESMVALVLVDHMMVANKDKLLKGEL
ncbi:MAG: chorismate synthase [Nitrospinota bacterium]